MHENTSPQFSNKTSEDKLTFSILPTGLPIYVLPRSKTLQTTIIRGKKVGRGGGGEIISPKVERYFASQKLWSEILASIMEQNKLKWLTSVS